LTIAKAVGANLDRDLYFGERATEKTVKGFDFEPYRVISFATHGLIPGDLNGLYEPVLALTNPIVSGEKEDGLLTMTKVLGLKLNADLAILSACNTAAAEGKGSEAVSGLGRAFLYAGAGSIIASHWPVSSSATTTMMGHFFDKLSADTTLSRATALQQARLYLIDDKNFEFNGAPHYAYAHPIFWAPFTLIGDGGTIQPGA